MLLTDRATLARAVGSHCFIHSAALCIFVGEFNTFPFKKLGVFSCSFYAEPGAGAMVGECEPVQTLASVLNSTQPGAVSCQHLDSEKTNSSPSGSIPPTPRSQAYVSGSPFSPRETPGAEGFLQLHQAEPGGATEVNDCHGFSICPAVMQLLCACLGFGSLFTAFGISLKGNLLLKGTAPCVTELVVSGSRRVWGCLSCHLADMNTFSWHRDRLCLSLDWEPLED